MKLILLLILICLVMILVVMTVMYRRVRKTYGETKFTTWLMMKSTKDVELMLRVLCADNGHNPYDEEGLRAWLHEKCREGYHDGDKRAR